jgi:hypothetical protein
LNESKKTPRWQYLLTRFKRGVCLHGDQVKLIDFVNEKPNSSSNTLSALSYIQTVAQLGTSSDKKDKDCC